jgi:hypothetical protein
MVFSNMKFFAKVLKQLRNWFVALENLAARLLPYSFEVDWASKLEDLSLEYELA